MSEIGLLHGWFNSGNHIPLGLLYLAGMLEENGTCVDVKDYALNNMKTDNVVEEFAQFSSGYSITGISTVNFFLPYVILACQQLKEQNPDSTIVLGRPGPSGVASALVKTFPCIDAVVVGEGELTFLELVTQIEQGKNLSHVPGLIFKKEDSVVQTPTRRRILNLDQLPFPPYEKIDFAEYWENYTEGDVFPVHIITSRGCPFSCTFCDVSAMWGRKNCSRSIENILEEIVLLKEKFNQNKFHIVDDTFVLNEHRVVEFCRKIRDLNVQWECFGRVNLMSSDLMEEMSSAGCKRVFYGLESGSDRILRLIEKGISANQARNLTIESQEYFHVVASFIWGYPFENTIDSLKTWKLINTLSKHGIEIILNLLQPLPHSAIYNAYKNRLQFSMDVLTEFFNPPFIDQRALTLVKKYPHIFPSFYYYKSKHLEKNLKIVISQRNFLR